MPELNKVPTGLPLVQPNLVPAHPLTLPPETTGDLPVTSGYPTLPSAHLAPQPQPRGSLETHLHAS